MEVIFLPCLGLQTPTHSSIAASKVMRRGGALQALLALALAVGFLGSAQALRFDSRQRLKIVQAADIHFGEDGDADHATSQASLNLRPTLAHPAAPRSVNSS